MHKAGRIVLPKRVRESFELAAGDKLELESEGEMITLRPVRSTVQLKKTRRLGLSFRRAARGHNGRSDDRGGAPRTR
jgi:AbrB family looped-hinge helix DNA binding protein